MYLHNTLDMLAHPAYSVLGYKLYGKTIILLEANECGFSSCSNRHSYKISKDNHHAPILTPSLPPQRDKPCIWSELQGPFKRKQVKSKTQSRRLLFDIIIRRNYSHDFIPSKTILRLKTVFYHACVIAGIYLSIVGEKRWIK